MSEKIVRLNEDVIVVDEVPARHIIILQVKMLPNDLKGLV